MSLDTSAGTIVWAAPDWEDVHDWVSLLGAYVNLVEPDADVCLVLDASGDGPPTNVVVELVSQACMGLTDGRPFAEILLLDAPEPRPERAVTVTSAGTLVAALGLPRPDRPRGPRGARRARDLGQAHHRRSARPPGPLALRQRPRSRQRRASRWSPCASPSGATSRRC